MPQVLVKFRDLDTDQRTQEVLPIDRVPDNELRQEQLLSELVLERYPGARQRSFADGVSSFVGRQHLIVARFLREDEAEIDAGASAKDQEHPQDQLFAA